MASLGQRVQHPVKEVRHQAILRLQSICLSPEFTQGIAKDEKKSHVFECFDSVIFPLLEQLLKTEESHLHEAKVKSIGLLNRTFLTFIPQLEHSKELERLWIQILDYMTQFGQWGKAKQIESLVHHAYLGGRYPRTPQEYDTCFKLG